MESSNDLWSAVWPGLILGGYFIGGLIIYLFRVAMHGPYRDAEIAARGKTILIGMAPRNFLAWVINPCVSLLVRWKISPNTVTGVSVLIAAAAAVALGAGRFSLGGWLYLLAGACDFIDGRLARRSGRASPAGAVLDSVLDRYAESVVLAGLAWFYRGSWVLLAVVAALIGSNLVPYVRARGEGLGLEVKSGLMQRPERLVILGLAAAVAPLGEALLVAAIVVLAVGTNLTTIQRLADVARRLER